MGRRPGQGQRDHANFRLRELRLAHRDKLFVARESYAARPWFSKKKSGEYWCLTAIDWLRTDRIFD